METLTSWLFPYSSSSTNFTQSREIKFFIHDEEHSVKAEDVTAETTLNDYLREKAHLTGTKNMCFEGGCGTCIVAATATDPVTNREVTFAANSCLVPIYLCSGWKIHTSEAIGNQKSGYHPVQKALVQFSGTQCGFCSSGMVMNMYAMYESGKFTMKDIDNSFGGNICRCTGYRPILSAFKSLATDASPEIVGKYVDIEDIPLCKTSPGKCQSMCAIPCHKFQPHFYDLGASKWMKVFSINEVLDVLKQNPGATYMIVGGNTATGVYRRTKNPDVYIDITSVKDLLDHSVNANNLVIGANMSLTNAMALFYKLSKEDPKFAYLEKLGDHIDLIANVPVRNTGTIAGNIFTKHEYHEFPSDIYLMFETAGATITIIDTGKTESTMNLIDFLAHDMKGKIIKSFTLPALDKSYKYESYKIMPRAQNAHALVNAGFLLKLDPNNKVESARIVYGSINPSFIHATNAEKYLVGKQLFDNATLQGLFQELEKEINPDHILPDPEPDFRRKLAIALCYKFILSITPDDKITARNKSGGPKQKREVSKGSQDYETNESLYPLTQPIPKLEALAQCTGQAIYVRDMPDLPGQLFAAFVLAKAPAYYVISKIDKEEATKAPGFVAYYDKDDIPGKNTFMPNEIPLFQIQEELFCSGVVKYFFQPVAIVVTTSQQAAEAAANLVKISFAPGQQKPLLTVRDVLAVDKKDKIKMNNKTDAKRKGNDVKHVIKGKFDIFSQYHYHMETQCCSVVPTEDGLDVFPTTQSMHTSQVAIAVVLNIPVNKINISVRRLGGGYGGKVTRNSMVSCSAALAAYKLQKPVKFSVPLIENMNMMGKRYGCTSDYEVGIDNKGLIQYMDVNIYSDYGYAGGNEDVTLELVGTFRSTYDDSTWNSTAYIVQTDNPTGTWCRAPGTTEALALIECIMDHIASEIKADPLEVRLANLDKTIPDMAKHMEDLRKWADVDKRKKDVEAFNKANRWVKKGLSVVPMCFPLFYFGNWGALVAIYQGDGSVAVSHAGVEMGQGINTKVAQVCAYALGIPLDMVSIKPSSTTVTPNAFPTAGSITSEAVCLAIIKACDILKERIKPIKEKMKNPAWKDLITQCFIENVDLCATFMFHAKLPDIQPYNVYGVSCAEVEVDLLTGLRQIRRLDIVEDTGNSMSPEVDIGQVEGAFMMGIGYLTCEQLVYSPEGELLTNRTWNYKPPGAKDIPEVFNVKFPKNNPNPGGVLKSKATAEPPQNMACVVPLAIRNAINSARADADPKAGDWINFNGPTTVELTFQQSLHDYKQYTL